MLQSSVQASRSFVASECTNCQHRHATYWGGAEQPWRCHSCTTPLQEGRISSEEALRAQVMREDGAMAAVNTARSLTMGISVEFLIGFTHAHECWEWPTWQVVRDVIKPATEHHGRCRYCELPCVQDFRGAPDVFASHCWGALWGDLVAAVSYGAKQGRMVWIDIFAVRQWPGNDAGEMTCTHARLN